MRRETDDRQTAVSYTHLDVYKRQLRDHAVERLVITQGIVQKPAKRPGAVERSIEQGGVLRENIHPAAHVVIRTAFIGEQPVDQLGALVRIGVGEKRLRFVRGRRQTDRVQIDAPEKSCLLYTSRCV